MEFDVELIHETKCSLKCNIFNNNCIYKITVDKSKYPWNRDISKLKKSKIMKLGICQLLCIFEQTMSQSWTEKHHDVKYATSMYTFNIIEIKNEL